MFLCIIKYSVARKKSIHFHVIFTLNKIHMKNKKKKQVYINP